MKIVGRIIILVSVRKEIPGIMLLLSSDALTLTRVSIPAIEFDVLPMEQLNYAHIKVERGDVTCRDIEHEFQLWADSLNIY